MNLPYLSPFANHLWQSTVFAGVAALLTLALRKNHARVRHWVWLTASCKFLVPVSLLIALGTHIQWRTTPEIVHSDFSIMVAEVSQPFTPISESSGSAGVAPVSANPLPTILWAVWACGFLGISAAWWVRWRRLRAAISRAIPVSLELPLPVMCVNTLLEPSVFGVFQPVLLLPEDIFNRLTPAQLEAVIAHELCHVRHRDNLIAAIHMFVENVFWFHPLVWWIGSRMVEERERACDQEVLRLGSEPRVYAEGILSICKLYVELPLACVSGVTGADLKKRIESIMKNRTLLRLDFTRKAVLAVAGVAAIVLPIAVGIVDVPLARAESSADQKRLTFDVASVKPATPPPGVSVVGGAMTAPRGIDVSRYRNTGGPGSDDPGRIHYPLISLSALLNRAYEGYIEIKTPDWADTDLFAVDATMPSTTTKEQFRQMLQNLLIDRFALKSHIETKEISGYALTRAKGGPKFKESPPDNEPPGPNPHQIGPDGFPVPPPHMRGISIQGMPNERARLIGSQATMAELAKLLGNLLDSVVEDRTGLNAAYSISVTYAGHLGGRHGATALLQTPPPSADPAAPEPLPDIFSALQTQLGLKLERRPVPVQVFVVDQMNKTPTGN